MKPAAVLLNSGVMYVDPFPFPVFIHDFCQSGQHVLISLIHNSA